MTNEQIEKLIRVVQDRGIDFERAKVRLQNALYLLERAKREKLYGKEKPIYIIDKAKGKENA